MITFAAYFQLSATRARRELPARGAQYSCARPRFHCRRQTQQTIIKVKRESQTKRSLHFVKALLLEVMGAVRKSAIGS